MTELDELKIECVKAEAVAWEAEVLARAKAEAAHIARADVKRIEAEIAELEQDDD